MEINPASSIAILIIERCFNAKMNTCSKPSCFHFFFPYSAAERKPRERRQFAPIRIMTIRQINGTNIVWLSLSG